MATTKKAEKTARMTARVHGRVTHRTPAPYLARVLNMQGKPTQIVIFVSKIERYGNGMPPFGRATVITSRPGAIFYKQGEAITVDNFRCLQRLELTAVADD